MLPPVRQNLFDPKHLEFEEVCSSAVSFTSDVFCCDPSFSPGRFACQDKPGTNKKMVESCALRKFCIYELEKTCKNLTQHPTPYMENQTRGPS
jgi:hypothetical protein